MMSQQLTQAQILKLFPAASRSLLEANSAPNTLPAKKKPVAAKPAPSRPYPIEEEKFIPTIDRQSISIHISGQIMGGKNHIIVCRNGARIPNKNWAKWRDEKVAEVKAQIPPSWVTISSPTSVQMKYVAGDRRRRDQPATIDSVWHVLEKAGIVQDDTLLWVTSSTRDYDKTSPGVWLTITW